MKKTIFLIGIFLLIGLKINAQELTCEDFKIGQFYIPETPQMAKYTIVENDSITEFSPERDKTIKKYIVIREKNSQTEWKNGIGNGKPTYEILEWIDDCTYRLTYDFSKGEMDEMTKWVNENNGIVISRRKIENKCLYYTATMTTKDGQKISQDGIICKE
ncbi:hypothetical protein [Neotamlana laminarinivorans]|uniref:Uncharacterized protein n=1 Tax=Neotamlana laminarinivorans TaxID=2883124 RepID=A0A9X1L6C4_9FLAO|nr:hypothetical protein [Tamlana laminarinivorans]MCB4800321.1 hypothetical protein [Tamlana laminarinivorans]